MRVNRVITALSFLVLFLGYYGSNTLFYHAHLDNGKVWSHSHPYKHHDNKTPFESHSHSGAAYNYIQQLNNALWQDNAVNCIIPSAIIIIQKQYSCDILALVASSKFSDVQLRAPPAIDKINLFSV